MIPVGYPETHYQECGFRAMQSLVLQRQGTSGVQQPPYLIGNHNSVSVWDVGWWEVRKLNVGDKNSWSPLSTCVEHLQCCICE